MLMLPQPTELLQCHICHLSFPDFNALNSHYQTAHTVTIEPKPKIPCTLCPKAYKDKNNLAAHMLKSHGVGEPKRKCPYCHERFVWGSGVAQHIKTYHPDQIKKGRIDISLDLSNFF